MRSIVVPLTHGAVDAVSAGASPGRGQNQSWFLAATASEVPPGAVVSVVGTSCPASCPPSSPASVPASVDPAGVPLFAALLQPWVASNATATATFLHPFFMELLPFDV